MNFAWALLWTPPAGSSETIAETREATAERQRSEATPQVGKPSALQLRLLQSRERVLAELAVAEGEAEESEVMELVEEFDESVDRFEHPSWRPMPLCAACRRGVGALGSGGARSQTMNRNSTTPSAGVPTLVTALVAVMREDFSDRIMEDVGPGSAVRRLIGRNPHIPGALVVA